ncbi:hypothetical protein AAA448_06080 [Staphylococcus equorum]|uniref:hypothetical protein n=1 Tax=Staphylococcus equorum TaxID=246432 RepID=UPI003D80A1AE
MSKSKNNRLSVNKNLILFTVSIIAFLVIIFDLFVDNSEGIKLSEVYVSLAAFIMLISTAILQNIDLDMQREELELTRKEMKDQTKEFEESNKQSKFFELLKSKEEIYMKIDSQHISSFINIYKNKLEKNIIKKLVEIERLQELIPKIEYYLNSKYDLLEFNEPSVASKYKLTNSEVDEVREIIFDVLTAERKEVFNEISIPKDLSKLYKFNSIIETMYVSKSLFGLKESAKKHLNGLEPVNLNYSEIYKKLKTEEEKFLYKVMDLKFEIEDL